MRARVPEAPERLARQVVGVRADAARRGPVQGARCRRDARLASALLVTLGQTELTEAAARDSLGALLKYQDDIQKVTAATVERLVERPMRHDA